MGLSVVGGGEDERSFCSISAIEASFFFTARIYRFTLSMLSKSLLRARSRLYVGLAGVI